MISEVVAKIVVTVVSFSFLSVSHWLSKLNFEGATLSTRSQLSALWRRLKKIETLPKRDQKALLHYLDALVTKNGNDGERAKKG